MGAPERNQNARGTGLTAQNPSQRVVVPVTTGIAGLAEYAQTLADASLWVAHELAQRLDAAEVDAGLIPLYAAVAVEMAQLAGELQGVTGIAPSKLGTLSDEMYDTMMAQEARALSLILSQCVSAWTTLQNHTTYRGSNGLLVAGKNGGLVANPVLRRMAGHMRAAGRAMRVFAANVAYRERGIESDSDLAARVLRIIEEERK